MSKIHGAIDEWVKEHPYLDEIANLQKIIASVLEDQNLDGQTAEDLVADWNTIEKELRKGIPALEATTIDDQAITHAADAFMKVVDAFNAATLPEQLGIQIQKMKETFDDNQELVKVIIKGILEEQATALEELEKAQINHGVVVFIAWNVLSHILNPLKARVYEAQKKDKWNKEYCPVCGQLPAMAQFVRTSKGRERDLVCGCCHAKWRYKRMGCPYCKNDDQKMLNIIELSEVLDMRIDTCAKCNGYIKTYTDEGNEDVVLSDWSTLHLDMVGKNNGFKRMGYQLYEI